MKRLVLRSVMVAGVAMAGTVWSEEEPGWLAPSFGPFSPSAHFVGAIGDSSRDAEDLAGGEHDPSREKGTVQGIELGLSLRLGMLEGFAVHTFSYGAEEEWENEWEEAFLKVKDLPGGFEVRGGRMLARFGQLNARHLHAWNMVDMPLVIGRFLGGEGLAYDGGEVTWLHQGIDRTFGVSVGFGELAGHGHGHGHGEHDEDEDDHDGHHGHGEAVEFDDDVWVGRVFGQFRKDDFRRYETGLSLAVGDEEEGRRMVVAGLDFTYTWREKGLEPGGRALVWTTEVLYRDVEDGHGHGEGHDHEDLHGGGEFGFYSELMYTLNQRLDLGGRIGYVEGNEDLGSERRFRVSPIATAYLDPWRRAALRLQYNYDDLEGGKDAHSVWLQLALSWGAPEVR
ncbi:MAG TPA: hypothetical protein PKE55_06345 [Kiritimatiellia bacterium]|nr:hypothetical protein [Kiritimatiellia bacterium]